ncbi:MAG: hypothetical protein SVW77_03360 [Candidatus Nanohaloarchaea archaeon]|nr:hypothetical protein [Candidatus Nanohaloarchaea archaeon]
MFSSDFVMSAFVFMVILSIGAFAWQYAYDQRTTLSDARELQQEAAQQISLLARTPGYPRNWNASTVEVAGFADPGYILDTDKLEAFHAMNYTEQTAVLDLPGSNVYVTITVDGRVAHAPVQVDDGGLGDDPVAYIVQAGSSISGVELVHALNNTGLTWDLYWPSPTDADQLDALTARDVYNYTDQGTVMFDDMLENVSNDRYETVIAENANVDTGDIQNEAMLEDFVEEGGTYMHTEDKPELIRDLFGLAEVSVGSDNGTVEAVTPLLNSSHDTGDFVQFQDEPMAFGAADTVFVNDTQAPHGCMACLWRIGRGRVYYAMDTRTETGGRSITFADGDTAFTGNLSLVFGSSPGDDAETVTVQRRPVVVNTTNGLNRGTLRLVAWR